MLARTCVDAVTSLISHQRKEHVTSPSHPVCSIRSLSSPPPQCIYKQQTVLAEEVVVAGLGGHLSTCSTAAIKSRVLSTSVVCVLYSPDSRGGNPSTGGCSQMLVLSTDVALTSDKSEIDAPGRGRQTTVNGQPTQSLQTLATG